MNETLFDVIATHKSKWLDAHLNLVESVTLEGAGLHGLELGLYRIALMRKCQAPNPDDIIERVMRKLSDRGIVPKPTPAAPPSWDDAPEWAQWRAQDENGAWYWYEMEPRNDGVHYWGSAERHQYARGKAAGTSIPNWRDTLQERPAPEPLCPVCRKPASEHPDGLFCCGHCKGSAKHKTKRAGRFAGYHRVFCTECGARTTLWSDGSLADAAWNRRA